MQKTQSAVLHSFIIFSERGQGKATSQTAAAMNERRISYNQWKHRWSSPCRSCFSLALGKRNGAQWEQNCLHNQKVAQLFSLPSQGAASFGISALKSFLNYILLKLDDQNKRKNISFTRRTLSTAFSLSPYGQNSFPSVFCYHGSEL